MCPVNFVLFVTFLLFVSDSSFYIFDIQPCKFNNTSQCGFHNGYTYFTVALGLILTPKQEQFPF
jgi:hypothetical protein